MEVICRKNINWKKTAKMLRLLRNDNLRLRRYVCMIHTMNKLTERDCDCSNCEECLFELDNSISQNELAYVFNVTESVIANWENGRSIPSLEDLMFYCQICGKTLDDIIVFEK